MSKEKATTLIERRVRRACYLALLALALMVWSQVRPEPLPVIVAMSVGQAIGTLSLAMFLFAVFTDLRRMLPHLRRAQPKPDAPEEPEPPPPS